MPVLYVSLCIPVIWCISVFLVYVYAFCILDKEICGIIGSYMEKGEMMVLQ